MKDKTRMQREEEIQDKRRSKRREREKKRREERKKREEAGQEKRHDEKRERWRKPKMFRKKSPLDELFLFFFCKSSESGRFFIIHMIRIRFWAQGTKLEGVFGRTAFWKYMNPQECVWETQ